MLQTSKLRIPLGQRLQTFSVLLQLIVFLFLGPCLLLILFYVPFLTGDWTFTLLYAAYWLWDLPVSQKGGRGEWCVEWTRNWPLWRHYCSYFPLRLVKTAHIPPNQKHMFCSHPHGVLCFGAFGGFSTEGAGFRDLFPGVKPRLLSLEGNFWMPGFRELFLAIGACSSSKKSIVSLLKAAPEVAPVLVVGGMPEIANFQPGKIILILKKRKGFIKLALQHGANLVPCFTFGETELYDQQCGLMGRLNLTLQRLSASIGFAPVLFSGRGIFQYSLGVLPHRVPLHVVIGAPIHVQKVADPDDEEVAALQEIYIDALVALYDKYNPLYGQPNRKLIIA